MAGMTYQGAGVNYDALDKFKRMAQRAARGTAVNSRRLGFSELQTSRGEPAYLLETPLGYLAHVEEGLGTKNLVADAMRKFKNKSYYDQIAQCAVAMIVNDMITLGALPVSVAMHLAVGSSDWFNDEVKCQDLIWGWKSACNLARCNWGPGETPMLKDIVIPGAAVISGSADGIIEPKERLMMGNRIRHGDAIILVESSGIHANGLTLAREIAAKLPQGYLTLIPESGRTYGEVLLDPTIIYVGLVEDCFKAGVKIHYATNITGHGWRKLMRAPQKFAYVIQIMPTQMPIFNFIQQHGPVDDREAYGNLNMGAGFALIVPENQVERLVDVAGRGGYRAFRAGYVEKSDIRKVVIELKGLEYLSSTLEVR